MNGWLYLTPDLILLFASVGLILSEASYRTEGSRLVFPITVAAIVAGLLQLLLLPVSSPHRILSGLISVDGLAIYGKFIALLLSLLVAVLVKNTDEIRVGQKTEFYALLLVTSVTAGIITSANHILLLAFAVFLMALLTATLAGLAKFSTLAIEGSLKYLLLQGLGAVFLFLAIFLVYQKTGTLFLNEVRARLVENPFSLQQGAGLFFLLSIGFALVVGFFPGHYWLSDFLQGAPAPAAAVGVLMVPLMGLLSFFRLCIALFSSSATGWGPWVSAIDYPWKETLSTLAVISMLVGAFLSLSQKSFKRVVANIVAVQMGVILIGLTSLSVVGVVSLLFQSVVVVFSGMGVMSLVSFFNSQGLSDRLEDWRGVFWRFPGPSMMLVFFLTFLVGLPPSSAFLGVFSLLFSVVQEGQSSLVLAAAGALALIWIKAGWICLLLASRKSEVKNNGPMKAEVSFRSEWVVLSGLVLLPLLGTGFFLESTIQWLGQSIRFILW
jgi:NADH-quinone oxidoreductase subunit N